MSLKKSATRRLSLLAGSSLVAASLAAIAFTGAVVAPTAAFAADECTPVPPTLGNGSGPVSDDPTLNLALPDSFVCSAPVGTYTNGVTYDSDGDLTVESTVDNNEFGGAGIQLTGNGSDNVTFIADGVEIEGRSLVGALLDVTTDTGDITVNVETVDADGHVGAGVTHGIFAESTGGGDVAITTTGQVQVTTGVPATAIGIEARSLGGDVTIDIGSTVQGEAYGIVAEATGSGALTLTLGSGVNADNANGIAAIDAATDTGPLDIVIDSGGTVDGGAGFAIRAASGAAVDVDNSGRVGGINFNMPRGGGAVDFSGVTSGGVTFTNAGATNSTGRWLATDASTFSDGNDILTMSGVGHNYLGMRDATTQASIDFGAGDDTFDMSAFFNMGAFTSTGAAIDFGTGTDTFNMSGVLAASGEAVLTGLEAFNFSGVIYMGPNGTIAAQPVVAWTGTDLAPDDVLRMNGATFTGSGSARVVMDVMLIPGDQGGCATLTGAADCLDLRDGSTAGSTILTFNDLAPEASQGGYSLEGITVVDVGGSGTSAASHFVLDPNTAGYMVDPLLGPVIERSGLFRYALRYDPDNQRHVLAGLPRSELFEYAMLTGAAQSVWHMTSETVTDRQSDLRDGAQGGSVWLRAAGEYTQREVETSFTNFGDTFMVDNGYKLHAGTIMGGMDLITGHSGGYDYVLGGQIGYVSASFDLNESESSGRFSGATGGVYGSLWSDWFFLDGALNANGLTLDHDSPGLGSKTNTYLNSVGGHAEAGIRTSLTEGLFAEPLLSLAYVRTSFEEISLSGGEVMPGDATSLRGALGLRLGGTLAGEGASATYFVTGRAWNEFEGESGGIVHNPGADLPFADAFSGAFGEAEVGVNVFNSDNTLSGFLTSGVKWKDGYSAVNLSLGVRMAW